MNKENKRKSLFFTLSISILLLVLSIICFVPTTMVAKAETTSISSQRDYYLWTEPNEGFTNRSFTNFYQDTNDETKDYWGGNSNAVLEDSNFAFTSGASLYTNSLNYLVFRYQIKNNDLIYNNDKLEQWFHLYKVNDGGGSSTELLRLYTCVMYGSSNVQKNGHWVGIKSVTYSSYEEKIGLDEYRYNYSDSGSWDDYWDDYMDGVGYNLVAYASFQDDTVWNNYPHSVLLYHDGQYTYLFVKTTDLYSKYYITMSYDIDDSSSNNPSVSSKAVSVYDILYTMYTRPIDTSNLFSEFDESIVEEAKSVINAPNEQQITISYLEQIENTPFATRKTKTMVAPVVNNILSLDNVAKVLDISTIEFMQSYCDGFTYDNSSQTYVAHYRESVCVRSTDADGHSVDYFLSPNSSFRQYYYGFVENGVFGKDCYNYYWNSMIQDFPEIWNIPDTNLYGYFGYTVIPNKYTLNGLWDDLFDSRSFSGSLSYFAYTDTITQKQYDTLLQKPYEYSWLSRVWNGFASLFDSYDGVPVSNYLFYVNDDGSNKLWVAENGADDFYDDSGALVNGTEDVVEGISDFFGGIFEDWGKYIFGFIGIILVLFLGMALIRNLFKIRTARQEYKNAKSYRRKR